MEKLEWTGVLCRAIVFAALVSLAEGGCGGCNGDSGEIEPSCPTNTKYTKMEAYTSRGWWGSTRTRYRTVSFYIMGNPVCCGDYEMHDGKCYKPGCGGCLATQDTQQPACRKARTYSRQQSYSTNYNCGSNRACTRTVYRRMYYKQDDLVCCPGYVLYGADCIQQGEVDIPGDVPPPVFNFTCGVDKYPDVSVVRSGDPYIVGGTDARPNEFPWQVSLTTAQGNHMCGGTIIDTRWILTAAHCVYQRRDTIMAVVGDHRLSVTDDTQHAYEVSLIYVHPYFSELTLASDIALLKLDADIPFDVNIIAACLPAGPESTFIGSSVQITGWGRSSPGTPSDGNAEYPDVLQKVSVGVVDRAYCEQHYGPLLNVLCATDGQGERVRSSCYGDSGGPMTLTDANDISTVIGVASFGASVGCAGGVPFGYTSVAPFIPWIYDVLQ